MARTKSPDPTARTEQADAGAVQAASHAQDLQHKRSTEIAALFGDGIAYDRERVIGMARTYMAASAEAMLEAGKCLVQLKENEAHGDFTHILEERLNIHKRTARRMMAASVKFLALGSKGTTLSLLGKSKLFELMVEDDDDLEALAEGGTLAGVTLDEMQTMSARELKAALAEERKRNAAKDRVIAKKDAMLNDLNEREERRLNGTRSEKETEQIESLQTTGMDAENAVRRVVAAAAAVFADPANESTALQARQTLEWIAQRLADLCAENNVGIELLGEVIEPGWLRAIGDAVDATNPKRGRRG